MSKIYIITGGIASGKSTVAKMFSKKGVPIIYMDKVAASLRESKGEEVQKLFGTTDPKQLREIIFNDPLKKKELESLLWTGIVEGVLKELEEYFLHPLILIEHPLCELPRHK